MPHTLDSVQQQNGLWYDGNIKTHAENKNP